MSLLSSRVRKSLTLAAACFLAASQAQSRPARDTGWPVYGGTNGDRYSPLTQITRTNVGKLHVAWTYDTHETTGLQTHPLILGNTLYAYTPSQKVIALEADTGKQRWLFDSGIKTGQPDRGLAFWSSTDGKDQRLFAQTLYAVWALDPATGKPIETFGDHGKIDLRNDLGPESPKGTVAITTPGTIHKDLIILGFRTAETQPAPHGDIRAYDVRTGALKWSFHTIPHPGEPGYETWPADAWKYTGGANNWPGSVVDTKRGIAYVPTGSAVTDFYGADRPGNNLYANSLLALNANTGKLLWHIQAVHHDMWDRDFPSPPVLLTIRRNGKPIDVVAQATKHGVVYVFDRVTGKPIYPIEEKPFPASTTPGEWSSPTQPMPTTPAPFARQRLTADMLTTRTPEAHAWAEKQFGTFISNGQFIPLSVDKQTVIFPGFDGGAEWGGQAADPRTGILYINSTEMAWTGGLTAAQTGGPGATTYGNQCAACHGPDRKGQPGAFPSLIEATTRLTPDQMAETIHNGKGRMPSFADITGDTLQSLLAYVRTGEELPTRDSDKQELTGTAKPAKYRFTGYKKFLDPDGYPAIQPPWGTLNALDLNTGRYLWQIPLGEYPELTAQGIKNTGSENYGGPIVTASGLVIIGATNFDSKLHIYDSRTGKLLWEYKMDFAGNATPATYTVNGKQYIVIAISNAHNPKAPQGAKYIAFTLP